MERISVGGKSANFDTFYPIFSILTPKFANFAIYTPNNANLDNFFPKKGNFGQIFTSESEESEEICSQFFCLLEKK